MTTATMSAFATSSFGSEAGTRERLAWLAYVLDSALRVPGTNIRVGADAALGLIPGLGNLVTTALSAYLILEAWHLGLPRTALMRMLGNVAVDSLVSSVPVVGNLADVFWRANRRNMAILNEHLDRSTSTARGATR